MAEGVNGLNEERSSSGQSSSSGMMNGDQNDSRVSENLKDSGCESSNDDRVCRDFLRNACKRGRKCKFVHPDDSDSAPPPPSAINSKKDLIFCHDFKNGMCHRNMCRFIHSSAEYEDEYLKTGYLHPHLLEQAICKRQIPDTGQDGSIPICKDYIMGDCLRKRPKCKFRHVSKYEYKQELFGNHYGPEGEYPESKRKRYDPMPPPSYRRDEYMPSEYMSKDDMRDVSLMEFRDRERELDRERDRRGIEEILLLRKQMDSLKKEVAVLKKENSDLRATNDFLLEKITTLGMSKAAGTVATVTVPTVSLASTIPVAQVSSIPLSISSDGCSVGSVVAMPTVPAQQQASAQSLAPQTQIGVAPPPPTAVIGPVGSVQVSLSQAMAPNPVTLTTVNLNTMAPQTSMAPSLTPSIASPMPCSAANIPQAMSMSGASGHSGHLVTYPIMTQPALRQQLQ